MTDRSPSCFLEGETIDLHAVTEADIPEWAAWFNDPSVTEHLPQGCFPNSIEDQRRFISEAAHAGRFLALVKSKAGKLLGVVSLSDIDHRKRSCQTASVIPRKDPSARFAALEAKCLVTHHAFETLGLDRVWAGQIYPANVRWSQAMELIGYRTEGVHRAAGRSGREAHDTITLAITHTDFELIARRRNGSLWPGETAMAAMVESIREREPFAHHVKATLEEARRNQADWLAALDASLIEAPDGS